MELPYRPCVGIMLLNDENKIFVAQRIDTKLEAWQMPQGGIDEGEDPQKAALRELYEETSISSATIIDESKQWYDYDIPKAMIPKLWGGKYCGQTQKWFVMRFTGDESEINIDTRQPEFHAWRWIKPIEVPKLIVPFKKKLYQDLINEFQGLFT